MTKFDPLPPDFLFGVATADHQCEAYDPGFPQDVWDWWETNRGLQRRHDATDFWNKFRDDLDLAKGLGCNTFRYSIAWTRVQPAPDRWNQQALDHYTELTEAIVARKMTPLVTLCHFVWPRYLEESGGLRADDFPDRFAHYAEKVRQSIGAPVTYWLTFNEPDNLVFNHSELSLRMAPGPQPGHSFVDQVGDMTRLIRNLFLAHKLARAALQSGPGGETAMVTMNSEIRGIPIWLRKLVNAWLPRHFRISPVLRSIVPSWLYRFVWSLTLLSEGDWWELGSLGRLSDILCPDDCVDQFDFLAFDFYYAVGSIFQLPQLWQSVSGHFEREPVYAPCLYDTLLYFDRELKKRHPAGKPVVIMENGLVNQVNAYKAQGVTPPASAQVPARTIREHVQQIQRARMNGVDVRGYVVWSITSNREWGLPFTPATDFGLFPIHLDDDPSLTRGAPTDAALAYQSIIATRDASD